MEKKYTYRVTIIIFFSLLVMTLLYIAQRDTANIPSIQAKNGAIDISAAIEKDQSVNLSGEWLFFYDKFLSTEEVLARHSQGQAILVPAYWNLKKFDTQANAVHGYGTYYLQVTTGKVGKRLAISLPTIGSAYRLYVDNELQLSVGDAGRSESQTRAIYQPQIVLLSTDKPVMNLIFQVANYAYSQGGLWYPIKIGKAENIFQEQKIRSMRSMFLGGFLLAIALYNLILFSQRKVDVLPLVFALLCIILGLREFFVQDFLILNYLPNLTFGLLIKIEYATFFLAAPLIMHFNYLSFPSYFDKRILAASYAAALLLTLILVLQDLNVASTLLLIMQLLSFLYIGYILLVTVKAGYQQQEGTQVLLVGSFIFAICIINDILYTREIVRTGFFASFGLAIYVLSQSYMASIKFNQAFMWSNHLSKQLIRRNLALETLSQSLEAKVAERTDELAQANTHLQQLAHTDPLTQIPNRRGISPMIEQEEARFRRRGIPYSLATIDLDHFKQVNDQYGHDAGDLVLKKCTLIIKNKIREQDKLARWGGEEFIVLLPETNLQGAIMVAEKIRQSIEQATIEMNGKAIPITSTIGVVQAQPNELFDAVFKRSDIALFKGKEQGRNKVVW